ncbi:MAG: M28 family peptidase [Bacteroidetes bacterium]|nr:M28 family peptidase [Bacteroidota bacterium]
MKKSSILVILLLFLVCAIFAQDLTYPKEVITKLTSKGFKGRGYVGKGDHIAAEYLRNEMEKTGVKPVGKDYYQKFNVSVNTFPGTMKVKINGESLVPGVDYLAEAGSPGVSGTFEIVQITRKDLGNRRILRSVLEKAKDAFLLVDNTDKTGESADQSKQLQEMVEAIKFSTEIDVRGVIVYSSDKLTWDAAPSLNPRPVLLVKKTLDLSKTTIIDIKIENEFIRKYETQNVVGMIEGSVKKDSFLVVTAHYDHLGMMGKDVFFPGANDNASGVAMMLTLAKYYSTNKPRYTMLFIALGAEELGILGAQAFVTHPPVELKKMCFLINLDLAGTGDEGIKVVNGSVYQEKFDLLSRLNKENNLLPKVDIRGAACISDHCLFYQKGVPCFYIYTLGGIAAYHDLDDKAETLPLTAFDNYSKLLIKFFDSF